MKTFFTADTHLGHVNIIDYCNRYFNKNQASCWLCQGTGRRRHHRGAVDTIPCSHPDVDAMDRLVIERWNARVTPEDTVIHLGDFAFGTPVAVRTYAEQLNGRKMLVMGNHDRHKSSFYEKAGFLVRREPYRLGHIWLSHRPPWPVKSGGIYLCGHIHNLWRTKSYSFQMPEPARLYNVGVDVHDYYPVQLSDLGLDEGLIL